MVKVATLMVKVWLWPGIVIVVVAVIVFTPMCKPLTVNEVLVSLVCSPLTVQVTLAGVVFNNWPSYNTW